MVQVYAPLTHGGRLPTYAQPLLTVQPAAGCDPAFVARIKALWATLDLTDRTHFREEECRLFRYQRLHGLKTLYKRGLAGHQLWAPPTYHDAQLSRLQGALGTLLGEKLLALLGPEEVARWFPWHAVHCACDRSTRGFVLQCASLARHVASNGQCVYASSHPQSVRVRGRSRRVAWSPHALQRLGERTVWSPSAYAALGDIFAFVQHGQYFESAVLHPDQAAFAFFAVCTAGHFSAEYAYQILPTVTPHTQYAYRVGYCPVVEEGDFVVAKTVLVPGYVGTPEYGVVRQASLDRGVKERMLARCEQHSSQRLGATQDFSLLRWFHTHGVPQVITAATPFCAHLPVDAACLNLQPAVASTIRLSPAGPRPVRRARAAVAR
jgi:hypothetical protein